MWYDGRKIGIFRCGSKVENKHSCWTVTFCVLPRRVCINTLRFFAPLLRKLTFYVLHDKIWQCRRGGKTQFSRGVTRWRASLYYFELSLNGNRESFTVDLPGNPSFDFYFQSLSNQTRVCFLRLNAPQHQNWTGDPFCLSTIQIRSENCSSMKMVVDDFTQILRVALDGRSWG